jgi:ADP-ribosylglycohydrolase
MSEVHLGIAKALALLENITVHQAASALGSGVRVSAQDTVPYCLWVAALHLNDYEEAMWTTVAGLGDRDTTCAIVGGIVAMSTGIESIPLSWTESREPIPAWFLYSGPDPN